MRFLSEIGNLYVGNGGLCFPHVENDPSAFPCDLYQLDLSHNMLSGPIPQSLNQVISLEIINLSHNELSGNIPDLGNVANLTQLRLNHNNLSGNIPFNLGDPDGYYYNANCAYSEPWTCNLRLLHLQNNQLSGIVPEELSIHIYLEEFFINDNQLDGVYPSNLCDDLSLNHFQAWNNNFCAPFPDCFVDIDCNEFASEGGGQSCIGTQNCIVPGC